MNIEQITQLKNIAGKGGALGCLLFFIVIIDAIISQVRQPINVLEMLPGTSVNFTVSLAESVEGSDQLRWASNSEHIRASFESVHKGFWLGQQMCRGIIQLHPDIRDGEYILSIALKDKPDKPFFTYRIRVYPDSAVLRQASKSAVFRTFGISPWQVAVILPVIILMLGGAAFWLSLKKESLMAQMGQAEVYQVKTAPGGDFIAFGLGRRHGIEPGMKLYLSDPKGNPVGEIEIFERSETDASALVSSSLSVKPGYTVSKSAPIKA